MSEKRGYSEKLKDPRWQRKRLEMFNRDGFTCQKCGDVRTELNLHHREYIRGCEPWDYPDDNFITLCRPCHKSQHPDPVIVAPLIEDSRPEWLRNRSFMTLAAIIHQGSVAINSPVSFAGMDAADVPPELLPDISDFSDDLEKAANQCLAAINRCAIHSRIQEVKSELTECETWSGQLSNLTAELVMLTEVYHRLRFEL